MSARLQADGQVVSSGNLTNGTPPPASNLPPTTGALRADAVSSTLTPLPASRVISAGSAQSSLSTGNAGQLSASQNFQTNGATQEPPQKMSTQQGYGAVTSLSTYAPPGQPVQAAVYSPNYPLMAPEAYSQQVIYSKGIAPAASLMEQPMIAKQNRWAFAPFQLVGFGCIAMPESALFLTLLVWLLAFSSFGMVFFILLLSIILGIKKKLLVNESLCETCFKICFCLPCFQIQIVRQCEVVGLPVGVTPLAEA